MSAVVASGAIALGLVPISSSISKLHDPRWFADAVSRYELLPSRLARPVAWMLGPVEFVTGVALFTLLLPTLALGVATGLFVAFLTATSIVFRSHKAVSCGCFGDKAETVSRRTIARLVVLIAATLVLLAYQLAAPLAGPLWVIAAEPAGLSRILLLIVAATGETVLGMWLLMTDRLPRVFTGEVRREVANDG